MIKVLEGDRDAYTKLYNKYFSAIASFISKLDNRFQSPEDIAQEVLIRIWENRAKYHPTAALKTYLFAYAKNVLKENKPRSDKEITLDIP
ncbi:MAG: RNA polymerase sigma factor [Planctomycetota bacterium]|jgi:RNA polymerase sigma-70 factor (ECF subfamily)